MKILEASNTELVRKMLRMKVDMEQTADEREESLETPSTPCCPEPEIANPAELITEMQKDLKELR